MPNDEHVVHHQRINYIDVAKASCIFLMIVGHWTTNNVLISYIYSFHMPALLVISGILFKPRSWRKTVIAFSVPVLFFSLFNLCVKIILGEIRIESISLYQVFFQVFHYRYGLGETLFVGDWFLWALLGLRFIFGDIYWLRSLRRFYIPIVLFSVLYMTFESKLISVDTLFRGYLIGRLVPSLPFFCFGFFLKDRLWSPNQLSFKYVPILVILFIIIPIFNDAHGIVANDYGYTYILFATCAILSTILLFWISNKVPTLRVIQTISKGTLVVLGAHSPILHILNRILPDAFNFIFPFITIVVCYYIILLCDRYFPILLGKVNNVI